MSAFTGQDLAATAIAALALGWLVRRRWRAGRGGASPACEGCEGCASDAPPLAQGETWLVTIGEPAPREPQSR